MWQLQNTAISTRKDRSVSYFLFLLDLGAKILVKSLIGAKAASVVGAISTASTAYEVASM